jgi:shikimate dehydrogenase
MTTLTAGLIGSHIQKTRLPAALKLLCDEVGIGFEFELIDTAQLPTFDFDATVNELQDRGWTGITVTHPYKTHAARYAGEGLLPTIVRLGASNTLVFGPPLSAHNTDYTGFISAWRTIMGDTQPGRVAMAGAGGVARALVFALVELGATDIAIWDIEDEKAKAPAGESGGPAHAVSIADSGQTVRGADGLINATALGMEHAPGMAFDANYIGGQNWAFDAVYTPTNTLFLRACQQSGLECLTGFDLFCHMALGSFEAYTGVSPDKQAGLDKLLSLKPAD